MGQPVNATFAYPPGGGCFEAPPESLWATALTAPSGEKIIERIQPATAKNAER
jgi:hypothetical protein